MRTFPFVIAAGLLAGCASARINSRMQSWVGKPESDLVARWGQPQAVLDDRHGGRVLVYFAEHKLTSPGQLTTTTIPNVTMTETGIVDQPIVTTQYAPEVTTSTTAVRMFSVDPHGRIYAWSWRGR